MAPAAPVTATRIGVVLIFFKFCARKYAEQIWRRKRFCETIRQENISNSAHCQAQEASPMYAPQMSKRFYITTAIDYVNGQPHLGHAYEKVITDVIARSRRSLGEEVFFLTGLDEHGQKVQQAAQAEGKTPQAYCDELAQSWKALAPKLGLTNDDFVRTTEPRHKEFVQALLTKLHAQGDLYQKSYRGWYSWRQEAFLTDKDRNPDGTWDPIYGDVRELVEENWFFKMGQHQEWLIDFLEKSPEFVMPGYRLNEVLGFLRSEKLDDLCISRPKARLNWGIPIPFAPDYVNYVWFDALVNYISVPAAHGDPVINQAVGREVPANGTSLWPADAHVIGKDILRFHAVYWPIMLKAAGLPLPKQILVHGWWQKDGEKISKTTGNVVDPIAVIDEWGIDAFRYYVVRELAIGPDGNWTDAGFHTRYNSELANGLGNLLNRSLSMLKRYRGGKIPERSDELAAETEKVIQETVAKLRENELQAALASIWSLVNRANQYVDQTAPFKLAKDPAQAKRLDEVLYNLCEVCRILAVLLAPFLPNASARIYQQLGLSDSPEKLNKAKWGELIAGHMIGEPAALFPRKDLKA
jgi:methionyl-tRNA synthetase